MNIVIGIPVYKEKLNMFEKISLAQVDRVLKRYKKVFIAPTALHIDYGVKYEVVRFPNEYFINTNTYSELLMERTFYEKFRRYKYLLIYQLDAFVFCDKLEDFCLMGYDYIGAPIKGGDWRIFHVGNGGLSLRNVEKCKKILLFKEKIKKDIYLHIKSDNIAEDVFWGYCGWNKDIDFKVMTPRQACQFSVQNDDYHGMRDIARYGLPFGCHYWYSHNYEFWKMYIVSYGYNLGDRYTLDSREVLCKRINMKLLRRYLKWRKINITDFNGLLKGNIGVFGVGEYGLSCLEILKKVNEIMKINIVCLLDNKAEIEKKYGLDIKIPSKKYIMRNGLYIIVASIKYGHEMEKQLITMELEKNKNFCSLFDLCENMLKYNNCYYVDVDSRRLIAPWK